MLRTTSVLAALAANIPGDFDSFATPPPKFLTTENVKLPFVEYYDNYLQDDLRKFPALILRPNFKINIPDLSKYADIPVNPVLQELKWNENGLTGSLVQWEQNKTTSLIKFLSKAKTDNNLLKPNGDDHFFAQKKISTSYVNNLEGVDIQIEKSFNFDEKNNLGFESSTNMPGITSPYWYLGQAFTGAPLHQEDQNLASVNLQITGNPKIWFVFDPKDSEKLCSKLAECLPEEFQKCDAFTRHKKVVVNPAKVCKLWDINVWKLVQYPGDYVVTSPGAFHQVYNTGPNVNKATNVRPSGSEERRAMSNAKVCNVNCKFKTKSVTLPVFELDEKPYHCLNEKCSARFGSINGVKPHMKTCKFGSRIVRGSDIPKVTCVYCKQKVSKLGDHIRIVHKSEVQKNPCMLCGFRAVPVELKAHYVNCRTCTKCGEKFLRNLKGAQRHICP